MSRNVLNVKKHSVESSNVRVPENLKLNLIWLTSLLFFLAAFAAIHFRSFLSPIQGEEGMFAFMLLRDVQPSNSLLIGSISGKLLFTAPEHPVLMYSYISTLQPVVTLLISFFGDSTLSFRILNLIPIVLVSGIAALVISRLKVTWQKRLTLMAVFAALISLPIFGKSALTLQTDTLFGATFFALAGVLFYASMRIQKGAYAHAFILLAGFLISLGKQEWAISSIAAALVVVILQLVPSRHRSTVIMQKERSNAIRNAGFLSAGIVAGSVVSFVCDPANYVAGFDVIQRTIFSPSNDLQVKLINTFAFILYKTPYTLPLIVGALGCMYLVCNSSYFKEKHTLILIFLVSIFNLLPGYFSSWSNDLRYLIPGAVLFCIALIASIEVLQKDGGYISKVVYFAAITVLFSLALGLFIGHPNDGSIQQFERQGPPANCAVLGGTSEFFLQPDATNWVSQDLGVEGAEKLLKLNGGAVADICSSPN